MENNVLKPDLTSKTPKIGLVGAGLMGHALAQVFGSKGHPVNLFDNDEQVLQAAPERIRSNFKPFVEMGLATEKDIESTLANVTLCNDLRETVADADFVIEAVSENLALKQKIFAEMEMIAKPQALLCSNTSAISITLISEGLKTKERVVGTHFWNPPHIVPCVEVIRSKYTSDETFEAAYEFLARTGKKPVKVLKDVPGFLGNRMQHALWREAISLVQQGIAEPQAVDDVVKWGFGMRTPFIGPLETADLAGLDLCLAVHEDLFPHLETTATPSPVLSEKVRDGDLGVKTGKGFHEWSREKTQRVIKNRDEFLIRIAQLASGLSDKG